MRFTIVITLAFHFLLLYQRASSSRYSIIENQMNDAHNVLEMFFDKFNKVYLEKKEPLPRQLVIVGALTDEFQEATLPLFESHPFMICTDLKLCQHPDFFSAGSFIVFFLEDLSVKLFGKNSKILSGCKNQCRLLFVIKGTIAESDGVLKFLIKAHKLRGPVCELVNLNVDAVKHYSLNYTRNCSIGIESKFVWKPGSDLDETSVDLFGEIRDLNGCPIPVGSFSYPPHMVVDKKKNGSLAIVGGKDGLLALMLAEKLNFTIALKHPLKSEDFNGSQKLSMLRDIDKGDIEFAVARFRPTDGFEFSTAFDEECLTFAVPRKQTRIANNILWIEFPWKVWAIIGLIFATGCVLEYALRTIILSRNGNRQDSGFVSTVLHVISIHLGIPVTRVPVSTSGRFTLAAYLCYGIVITTAYTTSLSSIITTVPNLSFITDVRGIINMDLKLGGSLYHREILTDQARGNDIVSELLRRYEVMDNHTEAMRRLKDDRDFAYLARRSDLMFEILKNVKAQHFVEFEVLNDCALTYPTVFVFANGSRLLKPINNIILRLQETGVLKDWQQYSDDLYTQTSKLDNDEIMIAQYTKDKFYHIFIFYCCCLALCTLVFITELLVTRLTKPKKVQRINRRNILL